jgi:hypothetical protein
MVLESLLTGFNPNKLFFCSKFSRRRHDNKNFHEFANPPVWPSNFSKKFGLICPSESVCYTAVELKDFRQELIGNGD